MEVTGSNPVAPTNPPNEIAAYLARLVGNHATGRYEYQRIDPPIVSRRDYTVKVSLNADEESGR